MDISKRRAKWPKAGEIKVNGLLTIKIKKAGSVKFFDNFIFSG